MQADQYKAIIAIEITHPDIDIQRLYTAQFLQMKKLFHTVMKEEWAWIFLLQRLMEIRSAEFIKK